MSETKTEPRFPESLRDYFAGQALSGFLSNEGVSDAGYLAGMCYEYADAMLVVRDGGQKAWKQVIEKRDAARSKARGGQNR